jgi:hypothetical protein
MADNMAIKARLASRDVGTGRETSARDVPPTGDNNWANTQRRTGGTQRPSPPSAPQDVNAGRGRPFNWRDYITVKHDMSYLDENQPERLRYTFQRQHENELITERTLDQLSQIPEIQAYIRQAYAIFKKRLDADPNLAQESGGKLRVSVSEWKGQSVFTRRTGEVIISAYEIAFTLYPTEKGLDLFTLQRALVHELAGHGSDASETPENWLKERTEALRKALDELFWYYPELKQEYDTSGTILGKPVKELFSASDDITFDKKFAHVIARHDKYIARKDLPEEVDLGVASESNVCLALNTLYYAELVDIADEQHERRALEIENRIMKKYYGEADRIGHRGEEVNYAKDVPPPPLRSYPAIKVLQPWPVILLR